MELKQLISQFTYRIEAKPEGGFVAHASDPAATPIEAPTREELQEKIRATIATALAAQFPALKSAFDSKQTSLAFHVEQKPGGGYVLQSADPSAQPIAANNHEDLATRFAEKLANSVGNLVAPALAQAIAAQANAGNVKVIVNPTVRFTVKTGSQSSNVTRNLSPDAQFNGALTAAENQGFQPGLGEVSQAVGNQPITPEGSGNWTMALFFLFFLTVAVIAYLVLHR